MIFTFKHYSGAYLSKWSKHRRNNSTIITRRVSDFFVFDGIVQFTLVWMFFRFFFKIANDFRSSTELWCFRADLVRNLQNNTFLPVPQRDQLTWDAYQRHMTFVFEIFFFLLQWPSQAPTSAFKHKWSIQCDYLCKATHFKPAIAFQSE